MCPIKLLRNFERLEKTVIQKKRGCLTPETYDPTAHSDETLAAFTDLTGYRLATRVSANDPKRTSSCHGKGFGITVIRAALTNKSLAAAHKTRPPCVI